MPPNHQRFVSVDRICSDSRFGDHDPFRFGLDITHLERMPTRVATQFTPARRYVFDADGIDRGVLSAPAWIVDMQLDNIIGGQDLSHSLINKVFFVQSIRSGIFRPRPVSFMHVMNGPLRVVTVSLIAATVSITESWTPCCVVS